jgi:hypothetical protein
MLDFGLKDIIICEACGKPAAVEKGKGYHHIKSKGAGGGEDMNNKLALCVYCHIEVYHRQGWVEFCTKYPHLKNKVESALKKDVNYYKGG